VLGAVAEFERAIMLERQREGIAKARCRFPPRFDPGFPLRSDPA
jgi:hypothetical protein